VRHHTPTNLKSLKYYHICPIAQPGPGRTADRRRPRVFPPFSTLPAAARPRRIGRHVPEAPLLTIPRNIHEAMLRHGLEQKPNECCGFLGADANRFVKLLVAADNIDKSTITFRIGPKATEAAYRLCEDKGLEVVAIYHSHTGSDPVPSIADVYQANASLMTADPDFRWIIMGLRDPESPVTKAYRITGDGFEETALEVVD
jgi:proteasome lid subunit RPN8/RPN11